MTDTNVEYMTIGKANIAVIREVPAEWHPNAYVRFVENKENWEEYNPAYIIFPSDRGKGVKLLRRNDCPHVPPLTELENFLKDKYLPNVSDSVTFTHRNGFLMVFEHPQVNAGFPLMALSHWSAVRGGLWSNGKI